MKKVAILSPGFMPVPAVKGGAVETLTTHLIEENEAKKKFTIDLYTVRDKDLKQCHYSKTNIIQIPKSRFEKPLKFLITLTNILYRLMGIQKCRNLIEYQMIHCIRNKKYDVLIFENNMNMYEILYNKKKIWNCSRYKIFHLHNDIYNDAGKNHRQCRMIADTADEILVVSQFIKDRFCSVAPNKKTFVFNNSINLKKFSPSKYDKLELRDKYGLKKDTFVVLYSGRISIEKGVRELVTAFKQLSEHLNTVLLIAGSTWFGSKSEDNYMLSLAQMSNHLGDKIKFTGYVENNKMPEIYALSDLVVIPSLCEEAFGMTALEAMSMQIPILATNSGALPEIVVPGCGVIIPKGDGIIENIANGISNFYCHPDYCRKIKQFDISYVQKRFRDNEQYYEEFSQYINCLFSENQEDDAHGQ